MSLSRREQIDKTKLVLSVITNQAEADSALGGFIRHGCPSILRRQVQGFIRYSYACKGQGWVKN
jgi:hypothetical protein